MCVIIADVCGFIFSSAVNVCDKVTDYFLDWTSFPQNSHVLSLSPSLSNVIEESFDSECGLNESSQLGCERIFLRYEIEKGLSAV